MLLTINLAAVVLPVPAPPHNSKCGTSLVSIHCCKDDLKSSLPI